MRNTPRNVLVVGGYASRLAHRLPSDAREHLAAGRRRRRVGPEALQTAAGAMLMAIAAGGRVRDVIPS